VAHNHDFPIGPGEICSSIRLSGVEAVSRKLISELLIFNENKPYVVKQNMQTVGTLIFRCPKAVLVQTEDCLPSNHS
jgi:hypothetical protein